MYRLVLLHRDPDFATEVADEVAEVARRTLQRGDVLQLCNLDDALSDGESPTAVLYLASAEACTDDGIRKALEEAREAAFAILPVGREAAGVHLLIPPEIQRLNAVFWADDDRAMKIARVLGLVEDERKLFLSYRRVESEQLALQLRHALSDRGYDVFLDRFSVPPAADFQRRLDAELADKAFVLLLESATAVGSDWVQHEVAYALAHHIAVLALSLPDADPDGYFGVVDDVFRLMVENGELVGVGGERYLTDDGLDRVLREVELQTARQLRRRREQLLGAVREFLFSAGAERTPMADWAVLAEFDGKPPTVHLVTPRAPTAFDLQTVDRLRTGTGVADCRGVVVHDVADRDEELRVLLDWIANGRPLEVTSLPELGESLVP